MIGEVKDGVTATYLRGINLICTDGYYYVFDAHGDVVNLTDASGNTVKTYDYDAFGVEKNRDESDNNPFRYCGEYWDSEIETYYLRARYYDPNLGRFSSEDPARAGLNLYTYCANGPIIFSDYSGESLILTAIAILGGGALAGGLFDAGWQLISNGFDFSDLDWRSIGASSAAGAVTTGMATMTGGVSLTAEATIAWGALTGAAGYGTYNVVNGTPTTTEGWLTSATIGGAIGGLEYTISHWNSNGFLDVDLGTYTPQPKTFLDTIKDLDDLISDPSRFNEMTPDQLYDYLVKNGYDVKPLNDGYYKGVSFKNGGGFKVNWGGDKLFSYHPEGNSHHGGAYYKISSGKTGTIRYDMKGNIIP